MALSLLSQIYRLKNKKKLFFDKNKNWHEIGISHVFPLYFTLQSFVF